MAYDEELADRVRRRLDKRRGVVEKKMMGGLCFMVQGAMCCAVGPLGLMARVGRDSYEEALAEPHVRPMEIGGRRMRGFVRTAPEGYRSDAALAAWIERGVAAAAALPAKAADRRKPPRKAGRR